MHNFNSNTENKAEWLTPPYVVEALGEFDLDPCAPEEHKAPWSLAAHNFSVADDGLHQRWEGRVWCNPPYGRETFKWLSKLSRHGNGIALIFARTETKGFHEVVFKQADAVFFFEGRLKFYHVDGTQGDSANAPSCLVAYGRPNVDSIEHSNLKGHLVRI